MQDAKTIVAAIRQALERVPDAATITISRDEFETLARPIEAHRATPSGIDLDTLRAILRERPRTAREIGRRLGVSPIQVKRAIALIPGVQVSPSQRPARGHRPNVYQIDNH